MLEELELDTDERIRAFTHPYRMKLLHALKSYQRPATATEVAKSLGDGPGKAHYHMRILEQAGIVVLARTEMVNGIVARYYEPAARHFSVKGAAQGEAGSELKDEVAKMIALRFKEGLKGFLKSTLREGLEAARADEVEPAGCEGGKRGFLFDLPLHCDAAAWAHVLETLDSLAEAYAKPGPGTTPRRLFVAAATDSVAVGAECADTASDEAPRPREWGAYWTFGVTLPGSGGRWAPKDPPLP